MEGLTRQLLIQQQLLLPAKDLAFEPRKERQHKTMIDRLRNKLCMTRKNADNDMDTDFSSWSYLSEVVTNDFVSDTVGSNEPQLSPSLRGHIGQRGPIMR